MFNLLLVLTGLKFNLWSRFVRLLSYYVCVKVAHTSASLVLL